MLEELSRIPQSRKIIGILDRDDKKIVEKIEEEGRDYKTYGNNVFAFCLPVPPGRKYYTNISIEFFYPDSDIKKGNSGKRLYFDNEVYFEQSASRKNEKTLMQLENSKSSDEYTKKIFDEHVGEVDWMHSKAIFSDLVENNSSFAEGLDFSSFRLIFTKLQDIVAQAEP